MLAKTTMKMFPTASTVGMHFVLTDDDRPDLGEGAQVVISTNISEQFVPGEDIADETRNKIGARAQKLIDDYKVLRAVYDIAAYQTKITQIDGALVL